MQVQREKNRVKSFEIDVNGRISIGALINNMQEAAWNSAESLGASVAQLQEKGISWVLTRFKLDIERFPRHREYYYVETWPSGGERSFVYRDYRIYNAENECIAKATSTWLVFDLETRKMVGIPDWLKSLTSPPDDKTSLAVSSKRIAQVAAQENPHAFVVRWHDIDPNQHLSNAYYFQCVVEAMPSHFLLEKEIRSIELNFRAECSWNETLLTSIEEEGKGNYLHTIRRASDKKILTLARTSWE